MKNTFLDDFIGVWDKALSIKECNQIIDFYEKCNRNQLTYNRQDSEAVPKEIKHDDSLTMSLNDIYQPEGIIDVIDVYEECSGFGALLYNAIYKAGEEYSSKWPHAIKSFHFGGYNWKIQKTPPGGGYHVWHSERAVAHAFRTFAWIFYLNKIEKGGETQFYYYPHSIAPAAGRLLLFPSSFQFTHRGNIHWDKGGKYICTGWLYLNQNPTINPIKER